MLFNTNTIRGTVLIISLSAAVLVLLVLLLAGISLWVCLLSVVVVFGLMYCVSGIGMRRYMIFRIKPLYQLLLSRDIEVSSLIKELQEKACDEIVSDVKCALEQATSSEENELERLRRKDRERTEFLGAIFHELRTPIFNIEGYTQTLLDGALEDPEVNRRYLERTLRSAHRLGAQVKDVEMLSQYEEGGATVFKEEFCILEEVRDVLDALIVRIDEKALHSGIELQGFSGRERISVYAERLRISSLLEELMVNAIRYCSNGGQIHIVLIDMFDKVLVEVKDNGCGIPAWALPRVFEPFFMVEKSRSRLYGGPGLGLTGVKNIIHNHGESITIRSQEGVGTTISFTLTKST